LDFKKNNLCARRLPMGYTPNISKFYVIVKILPQH
jgi:hypothetical protein